MSLPEDFPLANYNRTSLMLANRPDLGEQDRLEQNAPRY